tara:strand:- start:31 stop:252 length:222 start_codon:yes stop_codon:yes gene_type:complete
MKEFNNMTRDQQIEALAWEIEHHEQGIGYLQDLLEKEMKRQEWRMKKLTELKDAHAVFTRLSLVSSISEGVSQ